MEVQDDVTLVMAQSNIVQCCLMVEGLGIIATNSKEEYQKYLLKTLYIVLELAGILLAVWNFSVRRLELKSIEIIHGWRNIYISDGG